MSRIQVVYTANDNLTTVDGLQNAADDSYINNATVEITLLQSDQTTQIQGANWPLNLAYVVGSDGKYQVTLPDVLVLAPKLKYFAHVTADGGPGLQGDWMIPVRAIRRFE